MKVFDKVARDIKRYVTPSKMSMKLLLSAATSSIAN